MTTDSESAEDISEGTIKWLKKAAWIPVWVAVIAILYIVSPVLLFAMYGLGLPVDSWFDEDALDRFFLPLQYLYDKSAWYEAFIDWVGELLDG
ncbi:MAG: hypothetical protein HKN23_12630 [Verrucomicrobiales bacterium]|nr:hypothetical protein [Verrucomicrobiales bacterium]